MKSPTRRLLKFGILTGVYWSLAFIAVAYASLRTCGMSSDSVELCDLTTIHVVFELSVVGYILSIVLFVFRNSSGSH